MKTKILWLPLICLIVISAVLVSCGKPSTAATTPTQTQTSATTTVKTTTATAVTSATTATTTAVATTATAVQNKYGGILRVGDYRFSTVIGDPGRMAQGYGQRQGAPALESLMRVDKSGVVQPWLAKSWTTDPVAKTIVLNLNTGIMFSDGTPFNAAAVKWNLDWDTTAKQTGTPLIKSVDVVNDSTVRINLTSWDNTLLDIMGYSYIGAIMSPTTAQKHDIAWIGNNPVGTGPFIFETWIPQVTISYSKNANYWKTGMPYVDRIENVLIADQTVGLLNFKRGNTDMFLDAFAVDLPSLQKQYPNTRIQPFAAVSTCRIGSIFDSADPKSPFADVRVRQAAQYSLNNDEINKTILGGGGYASNGNFITPDSWGYNKDVVGYPYNPAKAKQLLADAGYTTLNTTYIYPAGVQQDEALATAMVGYMKAVGINCTLQAVSTAQINVARQQWDGMVYINAVPSPDPAASLRERYLGYDARYYKEMLIPADYKAAVESAIAAPDFNTKIKYTFEASKLFTDKYCLAIVVGGGPQALAIQNWCHDDGVYATAALNLWTPEAVWKDAGHK